MKTAYFYQPRPLSSKLKNLNNYWMEIWYNDFGGTLTVIDRAGQWQTDSGTRRIEKNKVQQRSLGV